MTETLDGRAAQASRILEELGFGHLTVSASGPEGEVAIIRAPRADWARLFDADATAAIDAVKNVGFRYVALDLDPRPAGV